METTYRIICALCIIFLRFPLYYLAPVNNISYTDVMNNDTNLCDNPIKQFLSKSEYTKECTMLRYPPDIDDLTLQYNTLETFLCLGMHDATYKVCQYVKNKKWTRTFSEKEDLDLSIQNITGFKPNGESSPQNSVVNEKNFCKRLSGYKPTYAKVQSALLKLAESLQDPFTCNKICIDINHKLIPLCAVLAWINQIDQTVANNTIVPSNSEVEKILNDSSSIHRPIKHQEKNTPANTNHNEQPVNIIDTKSPEKGKKDDTADQIIPDPKLKDMNSKPSTSSVHSAINDALKKEVSTTLEDKSRFQNNNINKTTSQTDVSEPIKPIEQTYSKPQVNSQQLDSATTDVHQLPKNVERTDDIEENNKKSNKEKNVNNKTISPPIEEIKSTTLSENTQDNGVEDNAANIPNPDDISRIDDDQLPNNLIDGLSQPMDAEFSIDGRNENIPDTSGQREVENVRVIKNDEESHFFTYFAITSLGFIGGYIAYHNKQKILAIVLEGRRSKNNRGRRRPSTANYRKLDCTLEEAVTSQCNANVTHVIY